MPSDGHGSTLPRRITGTGAAGTGTGQVFLTLANPAPVPRVYGSYLRELGAGSVVESSSTVIRVSYGV